MLPVWWNVDDDDDTDEGIVEDEVDVGVDDEGYMADIEEGD